MKTTFLLITLITLQIFSYAQEKKIVGEWLLTKVEVDGKIQEPYVVQEFLVNGNVLSMGVEFATWSYVKESNSIELKSERNKDFNGTVKILKLKGDQMILSKETAKMFYTKIDAEQIAKQNKLSGVEGLWRIENLASSKLITFKLPDLYTYVESGDGISSTGSGTWIFNKDEGMLIVIGRDEIRGKCTVVLKDSEKMVLKNGNNTFFTLSKESSNSGEIEHLTFDKKAFSTDQAYDRTEADAEKLPWKDKMEMMMSLVDLKQLTYKFSSLVEDVETFEHKTFIAEVHSIPAEQSLSIDNIFEGYDRHNLPEDSEFSANKLDLGGYSNNLYPVKDENFRISGTETVTTPAGTFDCLVIEMVVNYEVRRKLWMIKDKPGIYAKVIAENDDDFFGYYHMYELQSIE